MPVAKLRACSISDAMKPEQKVGKPEKEGHDSLDGFIRQAMAKEPFFPFSRAGESPVQWIQLLHALDQQGTNNFSNGPKVDNAIEGKEHSLEHCNGVSSFASEINGAKESGHAMRASGIPVKGTKSTSEQMQTLKIPEAVVAFAQATAKANGDPEKCWPLLSPLKVQMQKCDKCSREFCSPINYRRHIRVHRRSLNIDKDSPKNRELLGAFWDKLSLDEAMEIASLKNATLEEVTGSSIIKALTSLIRKPGFSSLPHVYVKAGAALLDIIQASPSRFPISSQELFSLLDDASEKTFLCAGTVTSMQKFVFDGEASKIGLEMKNLVACTSLLVEQKLVKAWLADKDAEALRCQKLLVEEEEAAQKRQAELLERKRLKKLRQKEQKAKDGDKVDFKECSPDNAEGSSSSAALSNPDTPSESDSNPPEASLEPVQLFPEPVRSLDADMEVDVRCCSGSDLANGQNGEYRARIHMGSSQRQFSRWPAPKLLRNTLNGSHLGQVPVPKSVVMQKHCSYRDQQKAAPSVNGHKVWTRKTKVEGEGDGCNSNGRRPRESINQLEQNDNCELLIGSICVTLGSSNSHHQDDNQAAALDQCSADHHLLRCDGVQEKPAKQDSGQNGVNRLMVKLWRPVGRQEFDGGPVVVQSSKREVETNGVSGTTVERILSDESCLACRVIADSCSSRSEDSFRAADGGEYSRAAEAFLAQRWKEAMATDHVKLVLTPETETPECLEILDGPCTEEPSPSDGRSILGSAENRLAGVGQAAAGGSDKPKFRAKAEKGCRLKYIPKKRSNG
ncbi:uncharacterized protein LOC131224739 isoform X2 [Magnolia sinica]|uniref:uncharacterized protein LOC131224739 isoform X2 n=1 Tax=Magnolia sinica TaxID=86752 RepID=UPI0026590E76|nr:uncharacterized protein LOC131224739 isoform X2 [Magnolia sinica]